MNNLSGWKGTLIIAMTGRNALLSSELVKPIELMRSMDWAFPGHCKGQGSIPDQALFLARTFSTT